MKSKITSLSWIGLAISSFALIIYILSQILRVIIYFGVFPLNNFPFDGINWICLSVFISGLAITALLDPDNTRKLFTNRNSRRGLNSIVSFLGLFGVLFVINIIVYKNPKTWDLSEQYNALAPETINILKTIPQKVIGRAYFSIQTDTSQAKRILDKIEQASNGLFTYEFIDPELNTKLAEQDGVDRDGTIVLVMGNNKEQTIYPDEESIDVALIRLINPTHPFIYFLTGHGEGDIESNNPGSYSMLRTALENKNYLVKTLNLAILDGIPSNARVIVIPGPTTPLNKKETENLQRFIDSGGSIILMVEANPNGIDQTLKNIVAEWALSFGNDVIIDPRSTPPQLVFADPLNFGNHPISNKMRGTNTVFNISQSLLIVAPPPYISSSVIAQSYPEAWAKKNVTSLDMKQLSFDDTKDILGPLPIAIAAENHQTKSRIVVFGDTDFVTNTLYKQGNGIMFLNSIDWASRQENLINLTPKNGTQRTFAQPGSTSLISIIFISICGLPLVIVAGGIGTWTTRRKKG